MPKQQILKGFAMLSITTFLGYSLMGTAYAQSEIQKQTLIQRIIEKFNLNKDEVQKVVDEFRDEKWSNKKSKITERLQEEVDKGNLTSEQRNKILAKLEELRNNRADLKDMSPEERKEYLTKERAKLEQWAKDNGIDIKYLRGPIKNNKHMFGIKKLGN